MFVNGSNTVCSDLARGRRARIRLRNFGFDASMNWKRIETLTLILTSVLGAIRVLIVSERLKYGLK